MHWSEKWLGMPYSHEFDCAAFCAAVRADQVGAPVLLPHDYTGAVFDQAAAMSRNMQDWLEWIDKPFDGCVVLMRPRNRLWHAGVFCVTGRREWVLHNSRDAGRVVLSLLADLPRLGLPIEGFYRWKS